jgi:hypothetical protein
MRLTTAFQIDLVSRTRVIGSNGSSATRGDPAAPRIIVAAAGRIGVTGAVAVPVTEAKVHAATTVAVTAPTVPAASTTHVTAGTANIAAPAANEAPGTASCDRVSAREAAPAVESTASAVTAAASLRHGTDGTKKCQTRAKKERGQSGFPKEC